MSICARPGPSSDSRRGMHLSFGFLGNTRSTEQQYSKATHRKGNEGPHGELRWAAITTQGAHDAARY